MESLEELYEQVKDLFGREEYYREIDERRERYGGLFDDETIARIIAAEEGRNKKVFKDISDIAAGKSASITGKVVDLGMLRTFKKGSGEGRVRNVRIDDGTGSVKLVLWDEDTDMVGSDIVHGSKLTVINGFVEDRGYGLQISQGRSGMMIIDGEKD